MADFDRLREDVAAQILRLSKRTLQAARQDPAVAAACCLPPHEKVGGRVYYRAADVAACLEERLRQPRLARKFERAEEHAA